MSPLKPELPDQGLSPRMRGNRSHVPKGRMIPGSIPAHAGEPASSSAGVSVSGVYPRACGGTMVPGRVYLVSTGLSPRMRGNQRFRHFDGVLIRSIPAHAGEPASSGGLGTDLRVYPRACGGTFLYILSRHLGLGLSPRMRGNRSLRAVLPLAHGSIPAHAGEPKSAPSPATSARVYPRACGGTVLNRTYHVYLAGLSPRMRGNLL